MAKIPPALPAPRLLDWGIIGISDDTIEDALRRHQVLVAVRHADPQCLLQEYADIPDLLLASDGL